MESNISTYKLEQGGKEYYFSTSIVGDLLRLSCKDSSNQKKNFIVILVSNNCRKLINFLIS